MTRSLARQIPLAILLSGLPLAPAPARPHVRPPLPWQAIAVQEDRVRLHLWRNAWMDGLRQARAAGQGANIAAAGTLLDPDAGLATVALPEGGYTCRIYKLGAQAPRDPTYFALSPQPCRYAGGRLTFLFGPQRPVGRLYPDDDARLVFLGALALGDEATALDYGRDHVRDLIGFVERIGDRRWRLVLPRPHWESQIDIVDIVPAPTSGSR